jgi:hypothetical protein
MDLQLVSKKRPEFINRCDQTKGRCFPIGEKKTSGIK